MFCAKDTTVAIRLTLDQIINAVLAFVLLLLAVLLATGCAAGKIDTMRTDITGLEARLTALRLDVEASLVVSNETNTPVSVGDVDGSVTVITLAGATPWTIAGLVGLLGLFQARRRNTATGALDRVVGIIESEHRTQNRSYMDAGNISQALLECMKKKIARAGTRDPGQQDFRIDRHERCIRDRLARMK